MDNIAPHITLSTSNNPPDRNKKRNLNSQNPQNHTLVGSTPHRNKKHPSEYTNKYSRKDPTPLHSNDKQRNKLKNNYYFYYQKPFLSLEALQLHESLHMFITCIMDRNMVLPQYKPLHTASIPHPAGPDLPQCTIDCTLPRSQILEFAPQCVGANETDKPPRNSGKDSSMNADKVENISFTHPTTRHSYSLDETVNQGLYHPRTNPNQTQKVVQYTQQYASNLRSLISQHGKQIINMKHTLSPTIWKFFTQKYRCFTRFDMGCLIDTQGWYSITPEYIASHTARRAVQALPDYYHHIPRNTKKSIETSQESPAPADQFLAIVSSENDTTNNVLTSKYRPILVIDAFCGCGGNAIQFALTKKKLPTGFRTVHVIAVDIDYNRLLTAQHNARIYGVEKQITFIHSSYFNIIPILLQNAFHVDLVYLSPPWGGIDYSKQFNHFIKTNTQVGQNVSPNLSENPNNSSGWFNYNINTNMPVNGTMIYTHTKLLTDNIIYFLPRVVDSRQVTSLLLLPPAVDCEGKCHGDLDSCKSTSRDLLITNNFGQQHEFFYSSLKNDETRASSDSNFVSLHVSFTELNSGSSKGNNQNYNSIQDSDCNPIITQSTLQTSFDAELSYHNHHKYEHSCCSSSTLLTEALINNNCPKSRSHIIQPPELTWFDPSLFSNYITLLYMRLFLLTYVLYPESFENRDMVVCTLSKLTKKFNSQSRNQNIKNNSLNETHKSSEITDGIDEVYNKFDFFNLDFQAFNPSIILNSPPQRVKSSLITDDTDSTLKEICIEQKQSQKDDFLFSIKKLLYICHSPLILIPPLSGPSQSSEKAYQVNKISFFSFLFHWFQRYFNSLTCTPWQFVTNIIQTSYFPQKKSIINIKELFPFTGKNKFKNHINYIPPPYCPAEICQNILCFLPNNIPKDFYYTLDADDVNSIQHSTLTFTMGFVYHYLNLYSPHTMFPPINSTLRDFEDNSPGPANILHAIYTTIANSPSKSMFRENQDPILPLVSPTTNNLPPNMTEIYTAFKRILHTLVPSIIHPYIQFGSSFYPISNDTSQSDTPITTTCQQIYIPNCTSKHIASSKLNDICAALGEFHEQDLQFVELEATCFRTYSKGLNAYFGALTQIPYIGKQ